MKATEILNVLKTEGNTKFTSYVLVNGKGEVYCNQETGNLMDFYTNGKNYGVYSELVSWGQVDSRKNSDDEILEAIEKVLSYDTEAKLVKREEVKNYKKTYMW